MIDICEGLGKSSFGSLSALLRLHSSPPLSSLKVITLSYGCGKACSLLEALEIQTQKPLNKIYREQSLAVYSQWAEIDSH